MYLGCNGSVTVTTLAGKCYSNSVWLVLISYYLTQEKEESKVWLNITCKECKRPEYYPHEDKRKWGMEGLPQQPVSHVVMSNRTLRYCVRKSTLPLKFWPKDEPSKQNTNVLPFVCSLFSRALCFAPVVLSSPQSSSSLHFHPHIVVKPFFKAGLSDPARPVLSLASLHWNLAPFLARERP